MNNDITNISLCGEMVGCQGRGNLDICWITGGRLRGMLSAGIGATFPA